MGLAELEVVVSVGMICAAVGFTVGLAIGTPRQPRWEERGSLVHHVSIRFAALDRLDAVLLRFEVEEQSRLAGVEVDELRLPEEAAVALVTRGSRVFVPDGRSALRMDDQVLVVTARSRVGAVEDRLRAVSRYGRLARWHAALHETGAARLLGARSTTA